MTDQSHVDWAALRAAFEAGGTTTLGLADAFRVSPAVLKAKAKTEQWVRPRKPRVDQKRSTKAAAKRPSRKRTTPQPTGATRSSAKPGRASVTAVSGADAAPKKSAAGSAALSAKSTAQPSKPTSAKRSMRRRLMEAIEMQLERLERHVEDHTELSSSDYEREARALNGLIKNIEAVSALDASGAPSRAQRETRPQSSEQPKSTHAEARPDDDQDVFRQDVAARLLRLRNQLRSES
ncbi:MAG: hypothetical protein AAFY27_07945 [Pseudomonadota bacterium]